MVLASFLDVLREEPFRKYAEQRLLSVSANERYCFPHHFPPLFRYRSLSHHTFDDIINEQLTITSIGDFNDLFDGAIHRYGSEAEATAAAEKDWTNFSSLGDGLGASYISHDAYVAPLKDHYQTMSHVLFDLLNSFGTYVCCFSEDVTSTLMWSHYGNSNKGIAIEYDFNQWGSTDLRRNMIFPVAYSEMPIDVSDLLDDKNCKLCKHPCDTAALCAALNKARIWDYEHEWRSLIVSASFGKHPRRLPWKISLNPTAIYFGYHFLKLCFYYDRNQSQEVDAAKNSINTLNSLLEYMAQHEIKAYYMAPQIGSYNLTATSVQVNDLWSFVCGHFRDSRPEDIQYYSSYLADFRYEVLSGQKKSSICVIK